MNRVAARATRNDEQEALRRQLHVDLLPQVQIQAVHMDLLLTQPDRITPQAQWSLSSLKRRIDEILKGGQRQWLAETTNDRRTRPGYDRLLPNSDGLGVHPGQLFDHFRDTFIDLGDEEQQAPSFTKTWRSMGHLAPIVKVIAAPLLARQAQHPDSPERWIRLLQGR